MAKQVTVTFPGGKRVDALVDGKIVHTDQPILGGGEGSAPPPFDLFAASLGACAGYFVLEFCNARSLPILGITLRQRMEFDEAHVLRAIELEIEVPPAFPDKYRGALARAAEGCAVKKAIDAQPRFSVRTSSPGPSQAREGREAGHV